MNLLRLFRPLLVAAFALCLVVVVLGAYVRLNAAGLGCPDWPGCYGHVTPSAAVASDAGAAWGQTIEVGKAWREMIHRYAASTLGLLIVILTALAFRLRAESPIRPTRMLALLGLVVVQGVLGMLTVTWQLKPLVVTLHLLFGMATLATLWWLMVTAVRSHPSAWSALPLFHGEALSNLRRLAFIALVALGVQLALGGWTSSNYAATACPDLPTCQGSWLPHMDFGQAFVLWRGLDVNYEGGVLDNPARVAIHFTHRVFALLVALLLLYTGLRVLLERGNDAVTRRTALAMLGLLALQLSIGILMVWRGFPLWLATAHNAGAALLLLSVVSLNRALRPAEQ